MKKSSKPPAIRFDTTEYSEHHPTAPDVGFEARVNAWNKAERRRREARTQTWARGASRRTAAPE